LSAEGVPVFSGARSGLPTRREFARSAAELWFSFLSRRQQFSSAGASCRLARRSRPADDERRLVLREAFLQPRDEPALSPVAERAPVSGAPLLSSSEPAPWLGQTYAWQRVCGRQVFLPPFLLLSLLPFYKFIHGSSSLSRARFLRYILFMDGVVDFTRLCFVHAKNVYQILNIGGVQTFQIRKAGFHQRHCLFFSDR